MISLLQKISTIINEKSKQSLYHFLEALYEYELPKPGEFAEIFSHDGMDSYCFKRPDRRVVPEFGQNINLQQFFAFFDLEKIIKIFTALLLERRILIVSKHHDKLTSCALSMEYLIYPLEWFYQFNPIMPECIDIMIYDSPFPFIFGIHPCIYEKLSITELKEVVVLDVDERQVIYGNKVVEINLPENIRDKYKQPVLLNTGCTNRLTSYLLVFFGSALSPVRISFSLFFCSSVKTPSTSVFSLVFSSLSCFSRSAPLPR